MRSVSRTPQFAIAMRSLRASTDQVRCRAAKWLRATVDLCGRALARVLGFVLTFITLACALLSAGPSIGAEIRVDATLARDGNHPEQDQALAEHIESMVRSAAAMAWPASRQPAPRVEVSVGQLDPRLQLAPCEQVQPYLPPGSRAMGSMRVGLRCVEGPRRWNVYLPVTVKLIGISQVAAMALPAGTVLQPAHLQPGEVDLAARNEPAIDQPERAIGRSLVRGLAAGQALYRGDLRAQQWFRSGDIVRVVAAGDGWQISTEARAMDAGIEGRQVRARTEAGQIITGLATGERMMEIAQ